MSFEERLWGWVERIVSFFQRPRYREFRGGVIEYVPFTQSLTFTIGNTNTYALNGAARKHHTLLTTGHRRDKRRIHREGFLLMKGM